MAEGSYRGRDAHDPEIRKLFTLDYLLTSDWFQEGLARTFHQSNNAFGLSIWNGEDFLESLGERQKVSLYPASFYSDSSGFSLAAAWLSLKS